MVEKLNGMELAKAARCVADGKWDAALFSCRVGRYTRWHARRPRICPGGTCFHVLNRAVARLPLFEKVEDYTAFERMLVEAHERESLPIFAYAVMPNHWHFVVRPRTDEQLTAFFRWLTHTHTMRWHASHRTGGTGHLYQGRFKSFPIQSDEHLLAVLRYVERNPLRAGLCERAEAWPWDSAWRTASGDADQRSLLAPWPLPRPRDWRALVNRPQSDAKLQAIRRSVQRGAPYGSENWASQAAVRLGLEHTRRPRGRPKEFGVRLVPHTSHADPSERAARPTATQP